MPHFVEITAKMETMLLSNKSDNFDVRIFVILKASNNDNLLWYNLYLNIAFM